MNNTASSLLGAESTKGDGDAPLLAFAAIPLGFEAATLALRDRQCRWPIGNPDESDFHFCTANNVGGRRRYCAAHEWDSKRVKRGKRPVVVTLGDTARRQPRSKTVKSQSVTRGKAPGAASPVTATRGAP